MPAAERQKIRVPSLMTSAGPIGDDRCMAAQEPPREPGHEARERDVMAEIEAIIGWRPVPPPPPDAASPTTGVDARQKPEEEDAQQ